MLNDYNDVMTVDEFCEVMHIGKNLAYQLLNSGEIHAFRIGRCWKIPKTAIQDFLLQHKTVLYKE